MATARWHREHLDGPQALGRIRDARAAGESWEAIGRAAGITRQTAHQRWAGLGGLRPLGSLDRQGTTTGAEEGQ